MTETKTYEELPLAKSAAGKELLYLPVYYRTKTWKLVTIVLLLFAGLTGSMTFSVEEQMLMFILSSLVITATIIQLGFIGWKAVKQKRVTTSFLHENSDAFLEQVKKRYEVTMTQTILYQLAQGGSTQLMDRNSVIRRIMLDSDPDTKTTILVTEKL